MRLHLPVTPNVLLSVVAPVTARVVPTLQAALRVVAPEGDGGRVE